MESKRFRAVNEPEASLCSNEGGSSTESHERGEEEPVFILQRSREAYAEVTSLLCRVWQELPNKDWFAIDEPAVLASVLRRESTLVFEACTPQGMLAAVYVCVMPETEEENLGRYARLPRSEWHRVMHADMAATLPAYRGHSLQRRLMAYAERFVRMNSHIHYLMATVHPDNVASRRSMEHVGYSCVAQTTLYGGLPRCVYCKRL